MSDIALYNTLRKIPDVSDEEAKEAAADVASNKEIATKADIAILNGKITAMQWMIGLLFVMNVAMFSKLFF